MFKMFLSVVKKIIIGIILLFGYNAFLTSLNLMIPINIATIVIAGFLDVPGMVGLALFLLFNY